MALVESGLRYCVVHNGVLDVDQDGDCPWRADDLLADPPRPCSTRDLVFESSGPATHEGHDSRSPLWWSIAGDDLLRMLSQVRSGEDPDMVYAEMYANSGHEFVDGPE